MHSEVAAIQIHMIVQGRNDEFHGVDAGGGGLNGHHAIGFDADVGGRHLEDLQTRADDPVGLGVSSLGHGGRPEGGGVFSTASSSSSSSSSSLSSR